jgi:dihydrofolate reductase
MGIEKSIIGVAAIARNGVIGVRDENEMPWRLGEYKTDSFWNDMRDPTSFRRQDMTHFENLTTANSVLMGKRTWYSIPERARPLKNRYNGILSRSEMEEGENYKFFQSKEEALSHLQNFKKDIYIMGGSDIYNLFSKEMNKLVITRINKDFEGDVYFNIDDSWIKVDEKPLGSISPEIALIEFYMKK